LDSHASKGSKELVEEVSTSKAKICVITGGEPLMYDLDDLTKRLKEKGFRTHIETSGAYSMSGDWDWVCLSPKKFKAPQNEVCDQADELKIIVFNRSDFKWAESYKKKVKSSCQLFLQPEYSKESEMLPLIIDYVKENPEWRISLQTHKIINVP
jgi:organic radical activating enzyme